MSEWLIRSERPGDEPAIHSVTKAAFADHPHSQGTEPAIIEALRADGDLTLSLVAEAGSTILGHAAFSPAHLSGDEAGWYTLGPVAVLPERQGQGIGRSLIEAGLTQMRAAGAQGVVVLGEPDLYGRFGFRRGTALHIDGPLASYFQVLPFGSAVPASTVAFAPGFASASARDR
ncbi:GNAT family N-acetyltransferase [Altererythrobacter soli]|uniref:GNAT family N-acetyltransferase n=1 Tax=Croceibacterium soli TaxID=1739690 RepID=A0A6I4UPS9_9SPHN|nr:N-acetyltransferase [Croceibacterium soli]MXP40436.1 GNAT family N-acetyltransferase [Croceibacterium soli]